MQSQTAKANAPTRCITCRCGAAPVAAARDAGQRAAPAACRRAPLLLSWVGALVGSPQVPLLASSAGGKKANENGDTVHSCAIGARCQTRQQHAAHMV